MVMGLLPHRGELPGHRDGGPPGHRGGDVGDGRHLLGRLHGECVDVDDVELLLGFLSELVGVVVVGEPLHLGRVCTLALVDRWMMDMMTQIERMSENSQPWQVLKTISAPNNFLLLISLILTTLRSLVLIF